jgi:hypothetical protein
MIVNEGDGSDALAAKIRHWYWRYVRAVGGIVPKGEDPESRYCPLYDGVTDECGRTRQSIWLELAQWTIDSGIDVRALLRDLAELHRYEKCLTTFQILHYPLDTLKQRLAEHCRQFREELVFRVNWELRVATVWSGELMRRVLDARYEISRRNRAGEVVDENNDKHSLSCEAMEYPDITRKVILDSTLDVSALTRFCVAFRDNLNDVAAGFFEAAVFEYLECPTAYNEVYGDFLPPEFRSASRKFLDWPPDLPQSDGPDQDAASMEQVLPSEPVENYNSEGVSDKG